MHVVMMFQKNAITIFLLGYSFDENNVVLTHRSDFSNDDVNVRCADDLVIIVADKINLFGGLDT